VIRALTVILGHAIAMPLTLLDLLLRPAVWSRLALMLAALFVCLLLAHLAACDAGVC
jgi:hypothetical protein